MPGAIVALVGGTMLVHFLRLPVETIGSRFGGIPSGLPPLHIPEFHAEMIGPLLPSILTVTMLGAIESLMSATVADGQANICANIDRALERAHVVYSEQTAHGARSPAVPVQTR